jgi:hypothetical protein
MMALRTGTENMGSKLEILESMQVSGSASPCPDGSRCHRDAPAAGPADQVMATLTAATISGLRAGEPDVLDLTRLHQMPQGAIDGAQRNR